MLYCSRGTGRRIILPALVVLMAALLLQGCAAFKAHQPEPPAPGVLPAAEEPGDTPDAASLSEEEAFDDEEFAEDDDFFDEAGLIEEFEETPDVLVSDPLAPFNRVMFSFNDKLLIWVIKPVATGYRTVTPTVVRRGVANFFDNLKTPVRFINSLLQGKVKGAGSELGRFVVNTTVGVLGFGDPAGSWLNLKPSDEDLGQTLGAWGLGNGFYIVWPVLGPSTLRDSATIPEYFYLNPVGYVKPVELSFAITAIEKINTASFTIDDYETLKASALDPYTFIRDLYIQSRNQKIKE